MVDPALESIDWLAPSTQQQLQGHLLAPEPSSCDCMSSWLKIFSASKSFLSQIPPPKRLEVLQDGALVSSSWGPQLPSAKTNPSRLEKPVGSPATATNPQASGRYSFTASGCFRAGFVDPKQKLDPTPIQS